MALGRSKRHHLAGMEDTVARDKRPASPAERAGGSTGRPHGRRHDAKDGSGDVTGRRLAHGLLCRSGRQADCHRIEVDVFLGRGWQGLLDALGRAALPCWLHGHVALRGDIHGEGGAAHAALESRRRRRHRPHCTDEASRVPPQAHRGGGPGGWGGPAEANEAALLRKGTSTCTVAGCNAACTTSHQVSPAQLTPRGFSAGVGLLSG